MIRVSEHAVLRYLERVKGIDLNAIRAEMATPAVIAAISAGARSFIAPTHTIVIEGKTIITVLDAGVKPGHRKRRKALRNGHAEAG